MTLRQIDQLEELEEEEDTQSGRYLTFALGEETFGIEIRYVREIIGMQPITKMPEIPDYVKGIINLRGKIIPVTDVRLKFKKEAVAYNDRTCIIVIETQDLMAGLIVDNVAEVVSIDDANIEPPPDSSTGVHSYYIRGIGKIGNDVNLLIDCEKLFSNEDFLSSKSDLINF